MDRREKEKKKIRFESAKKRMEMRGSDDYTPTAVKLPEGCERWKFKEAKKHYVDIIPYIVKENKCADAGMAYWEKTFAVHRDVGINNSSYCCLAECWGEPCPICEYRQRLRKRGADKEQYKPFFPQQRQLFIFKDRNDRDKTFIFDCANTRGFGSFRQFGEMLDTKIEAMEEDDPRIQFYHPETGHSLQLQTATRDWKGKTMHDVINIEFVPRKKQYELSIVEEMPCLDDCLIHLSYDELKNIFEQGAAAEKDEPDDDDDSSDDDDDARAESNGKPGKSKPAEDDDDDKDYPTAKEYGLEEGDLVTHKGVEYEITGISGDGTSIYLKDEDGNKKSTGPEVLKKVKVQDDANSDDDDDDDDDGKGKSGKASKDRDDDDDDGDDDDDSPDDDDDDDADDEDDDDADDEDDSDDDDDDDSALADEGDDDDDDAGVGKDADDDDDDKPARSKPSKPKPAKAGAGKSGNGKKPKKR